MRHIALITAAALVLASCASDGSVATGGKPVDKETTRKALCAGAQKVDIAFQSLAKAMPGVIPGKVMDIEGGAMASLGFAAGDPAVAIAGTVCAPVYAGDVDVAINTAINTTIEVAALLDKWKR